MPLVLGVTQDELAIFTSLSQRAIAGHLDNLAKAGMISCGYRKLQLVDVRALHSLTSATVEIPPSNSRA